LFREKIKATISKHEMAPPGSRILLAVSGGLDSTVLLDALHHLQSDLEIELRLCHVNHGLRGFAQTGARLVSSHSLLIIKFRHFAH
jgi:tRNA(Ile)-lysidine synthase